MKRLFVLLSLFALTAVAAGPTYRTMSAMPDTDAAVWIDGKLEHVLFEPAAVIVLVHLESGTSQASHAWPGNWVRDVRFVITEECHKQPREVHAEVVRQEDE